MRITLSVTYLHTKKKLKIKHTQTHSYFPGQPRQVRPLPERPPPQRHGTAEGTARGGDLRGPHQRRRQRILQEEEEHAALRGQADVEEEAVSREKRDVNSYQGGGSGLIIRWL